MVLVSRDQARCYTDQYDVSQGVIPKAQHRAMTKQARQTNPIERFHNTLRQRVARLVRATLSCSQTLTQHLGAVKDFMWYANLEKAGA
jgi:IS1 family transposase